ncbi:MAG: TlpA family protein disulfide reductase, partial [Chryseobacterium sp.]
SEYRLPNGNVVRPEQLDSVNKAWGGHGYLLKHDKTTAGVINVSPVTDEFLRQQAGNQSKLNTMLNKAAPDFILSDLKGKKWRLSSLKGKTVVLNFWFTTCPPCIQEIPELNKLTETYKGGGVVFLGLGRDDAATIKSFLKTHPFRYTLLENADSAGALYQVSSYPTSMVIDPKGIIRFIQIGGKSIRNQIADAINKSST